MSDSFPATEFVTASSSPESAFFSASSCPSPLHSVEWTDVDFKIPRILRTRVGVRFQSHQTWIQPIKASSGFFRPGRLHAVLGPSGSGKTTLLNVLCGRASQRSVSNSLITGNISFGGVLVDPVAERRQVSYILSEQTLHGVLTPFEAVKLSLRLRRWELSESEIVTRTNAILERLGISHCKDTFIGSELVKGISSGEQKRTTIATELVHEPEISFLDEPTTGLDSFTAFKLVQLLKEISSNHGKCVVVTIHQPASETFAIFDDVTFLVKGWIVYQGPVNQARAYFAEAGYAAPGNFNTANFVMLVLQRASDEEIQTLVSRWGERNELVKMEVDELRREAVQYKRKRVVNNERPPLTMQTKELMKREWLLIIRDKRLLSMRLLVPTILALFTSAVLWMEGKSGITQAHVAAITNVAIGSMMSVAQPVILSFPLERPIFLREYTAGMYSVLAYFFAKVLFDLPTAFLICSLVMVIDYFMTGLVGSYLLIFLGVYLNALAASALAFTLGTFAGSVKTAMELSGPFFILQFLFAGLWIRYDAIPAVLRWIGWVVPLKYGISIMYIGEFVGVPGYQALFQANNVNQSLLALYISLLVTLIVAIRALGVLALLRAARRTVF